MPIELKMPALSPTMEEGKLARWLVAEGDRVKSGDLLAEIETDKATMEIEAADEGTLSKILVTEGSSRVKVGAVIALIVAGGIATSPALAETPLAEAPNLPVVSDIIIDPAKASPLARRIAGAKGIDLHIINGSGPRGKIIKADLGLAALRPASSISTQAIETPLHEPLPAIPHHVIELSALRKIIARRLTHSKQTVPHFYLTVDCNIDPLLKLRSELNDDLVDKGIKLSVNDFLIKALAIALAETPDANVQFADDRMYRFDRVDIAVAVAIDGGLLTPVIIDAANKRLSTIANEAKNLATLARNGKLKPEQYQGGTASLSNLGMFGIKEMLPVINPPQSLILGVGAGERRPYIVNEELTVATILSATASFDHRAIDGAVGAAFMQNLKRLIEKPTGMLA